LVLLIFEGALRKWLFPGAKDLIYFLKDFVILGAYINFFLISRQEIKYRIENFAIKLLIFLSVGWCIFQAFNPSLGSLVVGFFGLKAYVWYIPLLWMAPHLFKSKEELYKFLRWYLLLAIPVGVLGTLQFFSPPNSPLNVYVNDRQIATFSDGTSDFARITATFSYISGYGVYLQVCLTFLLPLLLIETSKLWQSFLILELLLVIANGLMSGSRNVVFGFGLIVLFYLIIEFIRTPINFLVYFQKITIPSIIAILAIFIWFMPSIDAFVTRTANSQSNLNDRLLLFVEDPIRNINYTGIDGYGTGATHQATPSIRRSLNLPPGKKIIASYEQEAGKVMLDLGPLGFIFWYGLRLLLAINLLILYFKLNDPFLKKLALATFLLHLINLRGQIVFNHTFTTYYWFVSSFIFMFPWLDRKKQIYFENPQQDYGTPELKS
jgi:hypothetical protein